VKEFKQQLEAEAKLSRVGARLRLRDAIKLKQNWMYNMKVFASHQLGVRVLLRLLDREAYVKRVACVHKFYRNVQDDRRGKLVCRRAGARMMKDATAIVVQDWHAKAKFKKIMTRAWHRLFNMNMSSKIKNMSLNHDDFLCRKRGLMILKRIFTRFMNKVACQVIKDFNNNFRTVMDSWLRGQKLLKRTLGRVFKTGQLKSLRDWKTSMIQSKNEGRAERILRRAWGRMLIKSSQGCIRRFREYTEEAMNHAAAEKVLKRVWSRINNGVQVNCVNNWHDRATLETRRLKKASFTILSRPIVFCYSDMKLNFNEYLNQCEAEIRMRRVAARMMQSGTVHCILTWRTSQQKAYASVMLAKELEKVSHAAREELNRSNQAQAALANKYDGKLATLQARVFKERALHLKLSLATVLSKQTKPGKTGTFQIVKALMVWGISAKFCMKKEKDAQYDEVELGSWLGLGSWLELGLGLCVSNTPWCMYDPLNLILCLTLRTSSLNESSTNPTCNSRLE